MLFKLIVGIRKSGGMPSEKIIFGGFSCSASLHKLFGAYLSISRAPKENASNRPSLGVIASLVMNCFGCGVAWNEPFMFSTLYFTWNFENLVQQSIKSHVSYTLQNEYLF